MKTATPHIQCSLFGTQVQQDLFLDIAPAIALAEVPVPEPEAQEPTLLEAVEQWVEELNATYGNEHKSFDIDNVGATWIRVAVTSWAQRSVYGFVKVADGSIWKAAGWKTPAKDKARGSVFGARSFGPYSVS